MEDHLRTLGSGPLHLFLEWQQAGIPRVAAGVYTIWLRSDAGTVPAVPSPLVYVGFAGRSLTEEHIETKRQSGKKSTGLWSRLRAHASGRRSGDQLAVYIADRLVLPTLDHQQIADVANGKLRMDQLVQDYVLACLGFRWVETPDAATAMKVEAAIQRGQWEHGKPFLNPL